MILKVFFVVLFFNLISTEEWSYYDQTNWAETGNSCGGSRQSPININSNSVKPNPTLRLQLSGYDLSKRNLILYNSGHSAQVTLSPGDNRPSISGSAVGTGNIYVFENLHFHWGDNNLNGSEHSLDGEFGSTELHFVHYNSKYGSLSSARDKSDGIVVMTVITRLSKENNLALSPIITSLQLIRDYNTSAVIQNLNFGQLLPLDRQSFFRYSGSLTTPPCSETVTFIIFLDTIPISPFQLSQLRRLSQNTLDGNQRITSNKRNRQPLNQRVVEFSGYKPKYYDYIYY